jgi:hypothetical protein
LTVSAAVTDGGVLSYQWYDNTSASNTGGSSISGATAASYTTPSLANGTYYYYCVVSNFNSIALVSQTETAASNVATVTVNTLVNAAVPTIGTQPAASTTVARNGALSLTVSASVSDGGTLSYQWYNNGSTNSASGGTAVGTNAASYSAAMSTAGTAYYYCIVTNTIANNGDGGSKTATATSAVAEVTVTVTNAQTPSISAQPAAATVSVGGNANLSVTASVTDGGTLTYQWFNNGSNNANSGGTSISGATSAAYSGASTAVVGTTYYYVRVTNTIANNGDNGIKTASVTSQTALVTVNAGSPTAGVEWTAVTTSIFGTGGINGIVWGGPAGDQKFVAVGGQGKMAYSADGETWTAIPAGTTAGTSKFGTTSIIERITYGGTAGNEKFVAVGGDGKMAYSPDGVNWTGIPGGTGAGTSTFGTITIYGIAWGGPSGNEKFVAGDYSGKMAYSSDGVNWTAIPAGTGAGTSTFGGSVIWEIAWVGPAGNQKFIAGGASGKMAYSSDGVNWTGIPAGTGAGQSTFGTNDYIEGIAWGGPSGNQKFVAGSDNGRMAYSPDGVNWTGIPAGTGAGTSTFGTSLIFGIAYGNDKFVAVGADGKMAVSQ